MRGGEMGNSEAKAIPKTEEQELGLGSRLLSPSPSPSPSPAAVVEALSADLGRMTLEEKLDGAGIPCVGTGWGEDVNPTGWDEDVKPTGWEEGVNTTGWDEDIKPTGWEEDARPDKDLPMPSKEGRSDGLRYPRRPDCRFYNAGSCRFGSNCKFNHPGGNKRNKARSKIPSEPIQMRTCDMQVVPNTEELGFGLPTPSRLPPCSATAAEAFNAEFKNLTREEKLEEKSDGGGDHEYPGSEENVNLEKDSMSSKEGKSDMFRFTQRPDKPDCSYYLKTGNCQFGPNCKFNHPPRRKGNKVKFKKQSEPVQAAKEKEKKSSPGEVEKAEGKKAVKEKQNEALREWVEQQNCKVDEGKQEKTLSERTGQREHKAAEGKETISEREGQTECKYYSMPGGSKFGKAYKHAHFQEKTELGQVELNFSGLPMRPGGRECPYYMCTGCCKFATNCRYHHPNPIAVAGQDTLSGYQNGASPQQHASGVSALPNQSWPLPMTSSEPITFFDASPSYTPGFYPLPPQEFYPNPEWSGYQVPVTPWLPPEMNRADVTTHEEARVDEYPERPGQPECSYFMKNGDCKFKSACRFHHPKTRLQ